MYYIEKFDIYSTLDMIMDITYFDNEYKLSSMIYDDDHILRLTFMKYIRTDYGPDISHLVITPIIMNDNI